MMGKASNLKSNFLVLLITLLLCLLLAEVILRIVAPPANILAGTRETPKADLYGWAPIPHKREAFINPDTGKISYFTINSHGWKDVEHTFEKPEGIMRILVTGDSFTYGNVTLDDLYTRQMQLLLSKAGFSNVEVISIGVSSWGTDQELEMLQIEGIKYKPDIVIYQFCRNDVEDNLAPSETTDRNHITWFKPFKYEIVDGVLTKIKLQPPASFYMIKKIQSFLYESALLYNLNKVRRNIVYRIESYNMVKKCNKKNKSGPPKYSIH